VGADPLAPGPGSGDKRKAPIPNISLEDHYTRKEELYRPHLWIIEIRGGGAEAQRQITLWRRREGRIRERRGSCTLKEPSIIGR